MLVTSVASYWMVFVSLFFSLLLAVYPLPFAVQWLRPDWTAMVIIYWAVTLPWRVGVVLAWVMGLVLDGFTGVTLGQNALGLVVITYVCHVIHQRMRNFGILQQSAVVFVLVGMHLLLGHWVQSLALASSKNLNFLLAAATSACCWPLFTVAMRTCFRVVPRSRPI